MKVLLSIVLLLIAVSTGFAKKKTAEFKVYGNCDMCEVRIEKAARMDAAASAAKWDKETKMLIVKFDESKTSEDKIQKAIAKVGHDTELYRADDKVYNNLHSCCKYERPAVETTN